MYHNESLPDGLQQVADSLTPKFAMTFGILFTFCMLSSIVIMRHEAFTGIDWVRSKPLLAIAGMLMNNMSIKFRDILSIVCNRECLRFGSMVRWMVQRNCKRLTVHRYLYVYQLFD